METVQLNDAQARLPELVDSVAGGGEVVITRGEQPVARLVSAGARPSLADIQPAAVGAVLQPLSDEGDLLGEMLER